MEEDSILNQIRRDTFGEQGRELMNVWRLGIFKDLGSANLVKMSPGDIYR